MSIEGRTYIDLQELLVVFVGQLVELEEPGGGGVRFQSHIGELLFALKGKEVADAAAVKLGDK